MEISGSGMKCYWNSLLVSALSAVLGTAVTFGSAFLIEKSRTFKSARQFGYLLSLLPLALPGLVIGFSYVLFFSVPKFSVPLLNIQVINPFNMIYGTIFIIVLANIIHFYSVPFLTATAALKKLDPEFESISDSMGIAFYKTFFHVTVPLSMPAILEIAMYYFVNSLTTVSAVIFLYTAKFKLASIAIVNMDDAGNIASAAALSVLLVLTNVIVRVIYEYCIFILKRKPA